MISFVDNGLFISQNKFISHLNTNIFCSYNIILSLLLKFGFIVEHGKTDIFHFSRSHRAFDPPFLDLSPIRCYNLRLESGCNLGKDLRKG